MLIDGKKENLYNRIQHVNALYNGVHMVWFWYNGGFDLFVFLEWW